MPGEPEGQDWLQRLETMPDPAMDGSLEVVASPHDPDRVRLILETEHRQTCIDLTAPLARQLIFGLQQWLAEHEGMG
jgi:hypothetical protein